MKFTLRIAIYFFIFIFFCICAEILSRFTVKYDGGVDGSKFWYEYRLQKIDAYEKSQFDIELLIKNNFKLEHGYVDEIFVPLNLKTNYINVIENKRKTEYQPENFENTIYLFGGSTIFCAEVPDQSTVASQLQKIINKEKSKIYRVENLGVSGLRIDDHVKRIRKIDFKEEDILIFYDGVNEIYQYLYRASFEDSIIEQDRKFKEELNILSNLYISFFDKYGANYSFFFRRFLNPYKIPVNYEKNYSLEEINQYHKNYLENLIFIKEFTKKNKLKYFHIFQPNIFSKKNKFDYEHKLINNLWLTPNGIGDAFKIAESSYDEIKSKLEMANINSTNFSNIFNNLNEKIYLDYSHVNTLGNKIIAEEINKLLKTKKLIN